MTVMEITVTTNTITLQNCYYKGNDTKNVTIDDTKYWLH